MRSALFLVLATFLSVISTTTQAARIANIQNRDQVPAGPNINADIGASQPWNDPSEFILGKNNFTISSTPTTRYYDWIISRQNIAPDGLMRPMLLVNGMFPGPLVEANTGDRIVVKVTNHLTVGTALHWHGMFQNGTNWMDGTTGITQCPIPAGGSFTYNFTVPTQWGTYWWHAHAGSQYVDGIVGPLIIHSPNEPHLEEYDEDVIVMMSDFYHTTTAPLLSYYLSEESDGTEPTPDNGLINGRNSFNCSNDALANFPTNTTNCVSNSPQSVFNFDAGKRYRLRLINTGAFAEFQFSIDQHNLTVIEADGTDLQPAQVQRIPIHIGQRYSAIVTANQAVDNYWVRAVMNTYCVGDNAALNLTTTAMVHYNGAATVDPQAPVSDSQDWGQPQYIGRCLDLSADMLKPWVAQDAPPADVTYVLNMSFQKLTKKHVSLGYVNSTSWVPLKNAATLNQAKRGVTNFAASQFVISMNQTQTIELIINNYDEGSHPFHLHGHQFWVVGGGQGSYLPGKSPLNTTNPVRRDTATLQTFGYTILRFVNDNPGMWAFHCHIDWHMQAGLLVQFLSHPEIVKTFKIPEDVKALCGAA
ncbi:iron transport multicopper oxidase [Entomortierella parvispora]|uniref:Iron transport multicopper oxidase n=1 Tax=Entomortierella parvispora TaxID=205924 RepID=A0A9P3HGF1_9FUNG|nr:iron transport multicopper oxidase [Entomortierella parvispora]